MGKVNSGTTGPLGAVADGLAQLGQEDNGRWSSTRSIFLVIVGMVGTDVLAYGHQLSWMHVGLVGVAMAGKVLQKAFEKPAQGVINHKALEYLLEGAVKRRTAYRDGGADVSL